MNKRERVMDKSKWEYKKLGDICILLNGFAFKSEKYVDNGIRVMRITNVQKGEIVDDDPKFYPMSSQSEIQRYMLKENDLLVSLTGNVGRVGLLQRELLPAALNQRVACLRLKGDSTDLRYLFHLMNSDLFENECIVNSQGIAQKNMSTKWLSDYKLPVPPKEYQQRIVAELDCLNEMIAVKQEQLKEFDKLAQSIFYDMFGDPVSNEKGWEKNKLDELYKVTSSKRILQSEWQDNGVPFYKVADIVNMIGGKAIVPSTYIKESTYNELMRQGLVPDSGDILITSRGTLGECYIVLEGDKFYFQDGMITWLSQKTNSILPIYLKSVFGTKSFLDSLLHNANMSTVAYLSIGQLSKVKVPLPPLSLQQQFADRISAIEAQKELVKQSIAETKHLLDYTMDKYFG